VIFSQFSVVTLGCRYFFVFLCFSTKGGLHIALESPAATTTK